MSAAKGTPAQAPQTSFWGWGHESKVPDDEMRRAVASHVARVLGVGAPEPRPLPRIEDVALPEARVEPPGELAGFSTAARRDRVTHTYGKSFRDQVRGFEGDFAPAPDFVCYPAAEEEIAAVLAWASKSSVAVIPFGGGTSVVGGVEGAVSSRYEGVVSLDLGRMDRVLEVDAVSRAARIQAGARGPHIEAQLQPHDLSLRHYPQSFEFSTLGGWIATRAGGHFATLYTHIDDLVESIRMVTPAGDFVSRRLPASGAGPSPDRLVLGSEGIFGVITEAWVRAQQRPRFRLQASMHFRGEMARAVDAVRAVSQAALYPTNCRLLSAEEAALNFVTDDGAHVLVLGFESVDAPARRRRWRARWPSARRTAAPARAASSGARARARRRRRRPRRGAPRSWRRLISRARS